MPFVQTPEINIQYETAGSGKTVLVFLHGNFASWRWWQPVFEQLPCVFRAYAPNIRGCGETESPDSSFDIDRLAEDLRAFQEALQLPRFHLIGHSLGGAVALQFALDYGECIESLTLVAPASAAARATSAISPTESSSFAFGATGALQ